ncbi:MAG: septum formation inhibitor Maf [Brumimicrobium sp.]
MSVRINSSIVVLIGSIILIGCSNDQEVKKTNLKPEFDHKEKRVVENKIEDNYDVSFFSGKAEVSTYSLDKARYDGVHSGESVLIFVTEPFLAKKQVKSDDSKSEEALRILKMNRIDRFSTGIYDYSLFSSAFTPTQLYSAKYPLKLTFSSQDWCGQSFMQLNNNKGFEIMLRSYFESEGDTSMQMEYNYTEDNLFNMARIDTALLPTGEFELIPSLSFIRLSHKELKPYVANGSIAVFENQIVYTYDIPALKRGVRIFMNPDEHFQIMRWEETYPTIFDGKLRKSVYTLKKSIKTPYWEKNTTKDKVWRDSLRLLS